MVRATGSSDEEIPMVEYRSAGSSTSLRLSTSRKMVCSERGWISPHQPRHAHTSKKQLDRGRS